jgi:membrane-associated phospholipid phosphatase
LPHSANQKTLLLDCGYPSIAFLRRVVDCLFCYERDIGIPGQLGGLNMTLQGKTSVDVAVVDISAHQTASSEQDGGGQLAMQMRVDLTIPRAWDGRLAYAVSQIGSPPVLASAAMGLTASVLSGPQAWMWAGVYVLLAILLPVCYLVWLVRGGKVADLDVQLREQRIRPMVVAVAGAGLAWVALLVGGAPSQMVVLAGALCVQTVIVFAITLYWKISVHCTAAAGAATVIWFLLGTPFPLLIGVPLIAWSRVRLGRHTLAQTVAGTLLGLTIFLIGLSLVQGR